MYINSLIIEHNDHRKKFTFGKHNIIKSEKNSVGKSTLLRTMFFALGYQVPGTVKFPFTKIKTYIEITPKSGETLTIFRPSKNFAIIKKNNGDQTSYSLPLQENELLSNIWETDSTFLLQNVLGAVYLDQDKGWTLLNRGTVIGNIHFNIDELILGLTNDSSKQSQQYENILSTMRQSKLINEEIKKLKIIRNITELGEENSQQAQGESTSTIVLKEHSNVLFQISMKKKEINDIKNIQREQASFKRFVGKMKLRIQDPYNEDESIPVSMDNIKYFAENYDYIRARIAFLDTELKKLQFKKDSLERQLYAEDETELFKSNNFNLIDGLKSAHVEEIDQQVLDENIKSLQKENSKLNKIVNTFINTTQVATNLEQNILLFAGELDVLDSIEKKRNNYLFTSNLKSLGGTVLHNIVFSFKMAYVSQIDNILNDHIPIVLDSPHGREVEERNVEKTANILKKHFSQNQTFVATIYDFDMDNVNTIFINDNIMENATAITTNEPNLLHLEY